MGLSKFLKLISEGAEIKIKPQTLKGLQELEGGAKAVTEFKQNYTIHTLKDGSLFAEPKATQTVIDKLETEIGNATQEAISSENYANRLLNGEIPGGDSPITQMLNTSGVISGVTIPQAMLKNWKTLHEAADVMNLKLKPLEFDMLPSTTDWKGMGIKNTFFHVASNPKQAFGELAKDLVIKPTELHLMANKYGKHSRGIWKKLTGPLNNSERNDLNRVLELGNDSEEVFQPALGGLKNKAGDLIEVSDSVREAYYGTRMLMDQMYWLNNTAAIRQARANNVKLLKTADAVDPVKVRTVKGRHGEGYTVYKPTALGESKFIKWSKEFEDEGFQVIEFINKEGKAIKMAISKGDADAVLKEIGDSHDMIGYRTGYVPRIYEDSWAVNKLVRMKDGTYKTARISTAPTRVKANKAVSDFTKKTVLEEGEAEHIYIASRKNDTSTDVAYSDTLHNILDGMSQSEVIALKKALVQMGMDPAVVDTLEGASRFFSHKRNPFMYSRGQRLKDWTGEGLAKVMPADAAIQKYLQSSSGYAANAEYVAQLEKRFLAEFGELLTDPLDFLSPLKRGSTTLASNGRSAHEASLVRGQIERIAGIASDQDRIVENYILAALDKFSATRTGKVFDLLLDKMSDTWGLNKLIGTPSAAQGIAKIKGFTATAKLGLWNVSQAIVQGTAALNVLGKNPIMAGKATKDVMQAIAPEIMKIGRTAEGRRLYNLIDDSGFISGFDYVELQRVSAAGTDKLLGSRALRKVWDTNLMPYHLGEGGVRALAWFTERRILIDEILKGMSDLKSADIDKVKFLQRVNEKASITALNMSRVNQPLISRGFWGVPLQFKQFLIQQGEFLYGKKNFRNWREQAGVYLAWMGAFGIQGIPWLFDINFIVESGGAATARVAERLGMDVESPRAAGAVRNFFQTEADTFAKMAADNKFLSSVAGVVGKEKYDDIRAFYNRLAQSGSISAITDGELNIANRASLARVFTEYYGNLGMDDYLFGPGYQTAVTLIDNNITNIHDMIELWRNDEKFTPTYLVQAGSRSVKGLPGIENPLEAAAAQLTGQWRDTELKLIKDEPTLAQIVLLGTGFSPGKRGERFERLEFTQQIKEGWKDWVKERTKKIARLSQEGHTEYAKAVFEDSMKQIKEVNPLLGAEFLMAYSNEMLRRNLSEEQREVLYRHQDAYFYDSSYDKFFYGRDTYIGWGNE